MSEVKKDCKSCRKICPYCEKTYANANSLASHKSAYHRKPKLKEAAKSLLEDVMESKKFDPVEEVEVKQEVEDSSESESSTDEEIPDTNSEAKFETRVEIVKPMRSKNSLGKLAYKLDSSFDLMDAYEVKNLFIKLKEECVTSKRPFSARYMLFIDAIVELTSLTEICNLLNTRAVMLKNIFKKLEQRSGLWCSRIRSFRLNANY